MEVFFADLTIVSGVTIPPDIFAPLYLFRGHNISPPRARAPVGSCTTPWAPFTRDVDVFNITKTKPCGFSAFVASHEATSNGGTLQPIRQWRSLDTI